MKAITMRFLFAISLFVMIAGIGLPAAAQMREGTGAISGTIRWPKIYGRPNTEHPFDALEITALSPSGRVYGKGRHLSFTEADGYYECGYNIPGLPEGVPIRVSVGLANGYKWVGGAPLLVGGSHREFSPVGWSGEVILMRPSADIPARARGDFELVLVGIPPVNRLPFTRRNP